MELVWYNDTEDAVELLSRYTEKDKPLGIDKTWPARFLLRLQELNGASAYLNGSTIIDDVRRIKDAEEQQLMREASLANDKIMEQLIPLTGKGLQKKNWIKKSGSCMPSPVIRMCLFLRSLLTENPAQILTTPRIP